MESIDERSYDDGEIAFSVRPSSARADLAHVDMDADETATVSSHSSSRATSAPDNTAVCDKSILMGITGALKDVVREIQSLKQSGLANAAVHQNIAPDNQRLEKQPTQRCRPNEMHFNSNANAPYPSYAHNHNQWVDYHQSQGVQQAEYYQEPRVSRPLVNNQRPRARAPCADQVKIPLFTGKEDWPMWISRFEAIADRYGWNADDRLDQLLPRMEGQAAQFVFSQLSHSVLFNYYQLLEEMDSRFRPIETARSFAAMFSRRRQTHGETVEEYAADLKRLYGKGHAGRDRKTREEDLVRKFLDGLSDDDARFEVEFHKEPSCLDDAVYHTVNFLQMRKSASDRKSRFARRATNCDVTDQRRRLQSDITGQQLHGSCNEDTTSAFHDQQEILKKILKRLDDLEENRQKDRSPRPRLRKSEVQCFKCKERGHFARECPNISHRVLNISPVAYKDSFRVDAGNVDPLNIEGPSLVARGRSEQ